MCGINVRESVEKNIKSARSKILPEVSILLIVKRTKVNKRKLSFKIEIKKQKSKLEILKFMQSLS